MKLLAGILFEKKAEGYYTLSLGRLSFWLMLLMTCAMWYFDRSVTDQQVTFLTFLLAYNFGKKGLDVLKVMRNGNVEDKNEHPA